MGNGAAKKKKQAPQVQNWEVKPEVKPPSPIKSPLSRNESVHDDQDFTNAAQQKEDNYGRSPMNAPNSDDTSPLAAINYDNYPPDIQNPEDNAPHWMDDNINNRELLQGADIYLSSPPVSSNEIRKRNPSQEKRSVSTSASSRSTHSRGNVRKSSDEHCSHCPHCQKLLAQLKKPKIKLDWITEDPGLQNILIDMDQYDTDAIIDKIKSEYGHIPGCYDYRPHLTIDNAPGDYELSGDDYYKEPFVARKKRFVTPTHTPYPDYNVLQRREQRLNKPYTQPLFVD